MTDHPTEFDNDIFESLASMFIGEEILSELPLGGRLRCEALDYSVESLHSVDDYLMAVHDSLPADGAMDDGLFKVVVRTGSYVGEVLRRNSGTQLDWVEYKRVASQVEALGMGEHPATLAILHTSGTGGLTFPLGKVFKFLGAGMEESTHFFAQAMLSKWAPVAS